MVFPVETLPVCAIVAWEADSPRRVGKKRDVSLLTAVQHPN